MKVENYIKSGTVEIEDEEVNSCFKNLPENVIYVKVKGGSKLQNLLRFSTKTFKEETKRHILFSGVGHAVNKTITCAEITKRKFKGLYQITKINYKRIEETWKSKMEGLDDLKVVREVPAIYILLCKDQLDVNEPGYQGPESPEAFWKKPEGNQRRNIQRRRPRANYELPGFYKHEEKSQKTSENRDTDDKEMKDVSE